MDRMTQRDIEMVNRELALEQAEDAHEAEMARQIAAMNAERAPAPQGKTGPAGTAPQAVEGVVGGQVLTGCRTYSVEDVQEMLGIGRSSAYALVNKGVFRSVRLGGVIRISRRSFDEWFRRTFEGA